MNSQQQEFVGRVTTTLQIIIAALVMGALTFAGVAIFLGLREAADQELSLNAMMAAGATVLGLAAAYIVPRILRGKMRNALARGESLGIAQIPEAMDEELGDVGPLTGIYQNTTIIGAALLEGPAFYNLIAYMLEHQTISLICAAVLLVAMFAKFPTRNGVENWINDELKLVEEIRSLN